MGLRSNARLAVLLLFAATAAAPVRSAEAIRLGWQSTWAVQGQIVMGLTETDIPDRLGIMIEPKGFSYGAPLNVAALAGEVDVVLTADQPALVLLSKSSEFVILSRLMYNRVCVYAPPASPVSRLADLAGGTVLGPVGASAERVARSAIGVAAAGSVAFGALDMAQQSALVRQAGAGAARWPGADGLFGFDPLPADSEERGLARMLHCEPVLAVVLARRDWVEDGTGAAASFLCALRAAWLQYAMAPATMNAVFRTVSGLDISDAALDKAASLEGNFKAETADGISLELGSADFAFFDAANAFLVEAGVLPEGLDVGSRLAPEPLSASLTRPGCAETLSAIPLPAGR